MDVEALAWSLRLQETEALLRDRREDHAAQEKKREDLERGLEEQLMVKRGLVCTAARAGAQRATAHEALLAADEELDTLRKKLADGDALGSLRSRQASADAVQAKLAKLIQLEAGRNATFQQLMASHQEAGGATAASLRATLDKMTAKQTALQAQRDVSTLDQEMTSLAGRTVALTAERDKAQAEAAAGVAAADALSQQLVAAQQQQQEEIAALQEQLSGLKDACAAANEQQATNDAEILTAREQSSALRQQQADLEAAIQHAHKTIYHLAGSYVP